MRMSAAARDAMLDTLNATIGSGGKGKAYTGARPATPTTAATGTLLFTQDLSATPLQASSGGTAAFNAIADAVAGNSGTVGYYRVEKSDGTGVLDFDASELTLPGGGVISAGTTADNISLSASIPLGG